MESAWIIHSIIQRKIIKHRLVAGLELVKVVVERPIGRIGSSDAASYRTCCISTVIARTGRISQSYFSPCRKGNVAREQEAYGPYGYYEPRRGHRATLYEDRNDQRMTKGGNSKERLRGKRE
jgi:hypothetical protein